MSKQNAINRLADALTEVREHPPAVCDRAFIARLALRYGIHRKTMEAAIAMQAGGLNSKGGKQCRTSGKSPSA